MRLTLILILSFICQFSIKAQGTVYTIKGGLNMSTQSIQNYTSSRAPIWKFHGGLGVESWDDENLYALYANIGYYNRGSKVRNGRYYDSNGNLVNGQNIEAVFHNLSLALGAKQKFELDGDSRVFYLLALRFEANVGTELPYYEVAEKTVNPFVFGFSAGGGFEFPFSEYVGGMIEFSVSPDFTNQMYFPPQRDPANPNRTIPETNVKNLTIEVTLSLRLLNKVVYY